MTDKPISVLLVEDHPIVKKMCIIFLEKLNCVVDGVSTGAMALKHAQTIPYDIIFMDIGLPDISGLQVIQEIRKNSPLNANAPIVTLTAHSDRESMELSFKMGASDFLVKPFNDAKGLFILQKHGLCAKET